MEFNRLCVIGLGYIGLPTASTFATCGLDVIGVDVNPNIVRVLSRGEIHIHEPGLLQLAQSALQKKKLRVASQPAPADAFIIAVPTPFYGEKQADLRAVCAAAEAVVPVLARGNLVILESTSPPRTTVDVVRPILERSGLKAGVDFHLAYSPERVLPGQILRELVENDRVIGGFTPACAEAGKALYQCIVRGEIVTTDATTAEMVKLMENTFRDVNIAVANEFSRLADRFEVNVWEAIQIANRHPRVNILQPGPGVGGHCISVDPWFFVEAAPDLTQIIHSARMVNDGQPHFVLNKVREILGYLPGKRIAVLGLAYKPNVDDLRESPAVEITQLLVSEGAVVKACEPFKPDFRIDGVSLSAEWRETIENSDLALVLVSHDVFKHIQPETWVEHSTCRQIFDAVNLFNNETWQAQGIAVHTLGNGKKEKEYSAA